MALVFTMQCRMAETKNKYGYPLSIISDFDTYFKQTEADSNKTLMVPGEAGRSG